MKKTSTIRTICEVGMFAALGFVFDELQGILSKGVFVNGGSIGFAMIAVLIISFRRGWLAGILTGLIMGGLDIATSAYIVHPMQLLLDYIFPYAFVGLAGFLKPLFDRASTKKAALAWLMVGTVLGGLLKLSSHYFAGVFFWADPKNFAWNLQTMNPYLYCFVYNIAFIGPSIIVTAILMAIAFATAPRIFTNKTFVEEDTRETQSLEKPIVSGVVISGGAFVFIFYLIKYIKSFYVETYEGAIDYSFDSDSMLIFILGLLTMIVGIVSLISYFKKKFSYVFLTGSLSAITFASIIYSIARWLKMIVKSKSYFNYLLWYAISVVILAVFASLLVSFLSERKETKKLASSN